MLDDAAPDGYSGALHWTSRELRGGKMFDVCMLVCRMKMKIRMKLMMIGRENGDFGVPSISYGRLYK